MEMAFTVSIEDEGERTMDRSGSVTEMQVILQNLPVGEIRNKKEDRSRGRKGTRTSHSVRAEQICCCNCPIFFNVICMK
jgi:hypothetical protein